MDEETPLLLAASGLGIKQQTDSIAPHVDFDPDGDPENPQEWPRLYKWGIILLLAFMAFTV